MSKVIRKIRWQYKALLAVALMAVLATSALAFTAIFTYHGSLNLKDYEGFSAPSGYYFGPPLSNYSGPATVQVQAILLKPNEVVPWHYHVGLTYAILVRGTLTSTACPGGTATFHAGAGFVESPGLIHTVKNTGDETALVYWATVYPNVKGVSDLNVLDHAPGCE